MSWFPCCGASTPPCIHCSTDDTNVSVTFGNIAADDCAACTDFNATWVLDRDATNMCLWEKFGSITCGTYTGTLYYEMNAWVTYDDEDHKIWWVNLRYQHSRWGLFWPYEKFTWRYDSGSSSTMDCTAERTATFYSYESPFWPAYDYRQCYYSSTPTCVIN